MILLFLDLLSDDRGRLAIFVWRERLLLLLRLLFMLFLRMILDRDLTLMSAFLRRGRHRGLNGLLRFLRNVDGLIWIELLRLLVGMCGYLLLWWRC